jgi:quercetin dioxygenase-like cupin family protein
MTDKHSYLKTHQLSGTGIMADIADEAGALARKAADSVSGRAAATLVKNGPLRVTLIAMRKGAVAKHHHVAGPATIQMLRGRMQITTPRGPEKLSAGTLYTLGAAVEHSHTALSDCLALLTFVEPPKG